MSPTCSGPSPRESPHSDCTAIAARGRGRPSTVATTRPPKRGRLSTGFSRPTARGVLLRQQAVLVRAGHHSDLIEIELSVRKIPYRKYGGLRFLEAAHVKDFVCAARLLDNSCDEVAWYRILRLHRNIGPTRAKALMDAVRPSEADALSRWPELVAAAPPHTRRDLSASLSGLLEARSSGSSRT